MQSKKLRTNPRKDRFALGNELKAYWNKHEKQTNITNSRLFRYYDKINEPRLRAHSGAVEILLNITDELYSNLIDKNVIKVYAIVQDRPDFMRVYIRSENFLYLRVLSTDEKSQCFISRKPLGPLPEQNNSTIQCNRMTFENFQKFANHVRFYTDATWV